MSTDNHNLTTEERWKICQQRAKEIVDAYRKDAPESFDPKNTWVAVAGVVVTAGVGAYSASQNKKAQEKSAAAQQKAQAGTKGYDPVTASLGGAQSDYTANMICKI